MQKILPFSPEEVEEIVRQFGTPVQLYDEVPIRLNARKLIDAFSWAPGFKEYFAIKACPNPYIEEVLHEEGFGADCSSLAELIIAERAGVVGEEIMFSSNDTLPGEFRKAAELGAIINLDDISMIPFLEGEVSQLPEIICFRYNPGKLRKTGTTFIGKPEEAKYGLTREQLFEAYRIMRDKGVKRFGLHTMIASNELNPHYFVETAEMLYDLVVEISEALGIRFEFINIGGGIGIPYRPGEWPVNLRVISDGVQKAYESKIVANGLGPVKLYMENGRMITGPYGYLIATVSHKKDIYKQYVGLDACMANLMRPALYGAYHHITVVGKENLPYDHTYDVTGSLCENNDKFAIDRSLPLTEVGDRVVIWDTGAHGWAMGFQYNGKLRSPEVSRQEAFMYRLIRRGETVDDYLATIDFSGLKSNV